MREPTPRERFATLVRGPDADIDLAEAALLIAAEAYPALDVDRHLTALDALADAAEPRLGGAASDLERARALIHFLAAEQRFGGNHEDYYDIRNSFLNDVLERRIGIPITLALVYIEVGRRLGLPMVGVGFPGHFLVKLAGPEDIVIDPFFGRILDERACAERLRTVAGKDATFDRRLLRAATVKEILVRMLRNLKQIYLQTRQFEPALACSERILLVEPELTQELRDRGLLYHQLECYAAAQLDLERFLTLAPGDDSADSVRNKLIEIRRHGGAILH
jgi:regulator of sirC expression with transglutaminase-like and TPR domain